MGRGPADPVGARGRRGETFRFAAAESATRGAAVGARVRAAQQTGHRDRWPVGREVGNPDGSKPTGAHPGNPSRRMVAGYYGGHAGTNPEAPPRAGEAD